MRLGLFACGCVFVVGVGSGGAVAQRVLCLGVCLLAENAAGVPPCPLCPRSKGKVEAFRQLRQQTTEQLQQAFPAVVSDYQALRQQPAAGGAAAEAAAGATAPAAAAAAAVPAPGNLT